MIQQMERGYMTASEAVAVFRHGLNDELGVAAAARYDARARRLGRPSRQGRQRAEAAELRLLSAQVDLELARQRREQAWVSG